jgi:ribosome-associated protein
MDSKKLALLCYELADNKKAEEIVVLDVRKLSGITDFFVIASGTSEPHLRAITNEITLSLKNRYGLQAECADGSMPTNWIALDYFDVIVHVMLPETREFYDLEGLWSDAPRLSPKRKKEMAVAMV